MDPNSLPPKHTELVVGWYQQQLAVAQETIANLSAQNHILTQRVVELTTPVESQGQTAKGSDA